MRSQISIEYMSIVFGFLLILTPLWVYLFNYSNSLNYQITLNYAQDIVDSIRDASEFVYTQGSPATIPLRVHIPSHVLAINSTEGMVSIFLDMPAGVSEVYSEMSFNVTVSVPIQEGEYLLRIKAEEGYVNVSLY
jgi:hypothetical protein